MINYILQVVLFQVLFLIIYDFFLSKETFFRKNRYYLISTPILSFLIPLIKIPTFQKVVSQEVIIQLPEIVLSPEKVIQQSLQQNNFEVSLNYINILFWMGLVFFTMFFLVRLTKIILLIRNNEKLVKSDFILILLPKQAKAFSFFNYIFLGNEIVSSQKENIIQHELVHCKQKHSLDLLFFEFLKIVMWFNPMIYFYQKRITLLHEYISDAVVSKSDINETYINNLLSNFFQVENISFINHFYKKSLLKKRIIMMKKKQSKKMNLLKYLVLIPVLITMLFYTSCSENESEDVHQEIKTKYKNIDGKLVGNTGSELSYLDLYSGREAPIGAKEITINELSTEEKEEYDTDRNKFSSLLNRPGFSEYVFLKIYKMPNGRKSLAIIFKSKKKKNKVDEISSDGSVSFMIIDKAPTFPSCQSGDKECFSKSIQEHFIKNFNADLPKELGLQSGEKRIYIAFKIDKKGNIIDINARAPHKDLKREVIRVMETLPKMIAGEHKGNQVDVKYTFPFTINVE